jgi:hypothetical protein
MQLSIESILKNQWTGRFSKSTLLAVSVVGIIIAIIGIGSLGYIVFNSWQSFSGLISKIPAIVSPISEAPKEAAPANEAAEQVSEKTEAKKYIETAQKGEGITHLARRTLKSYLKDNPQSFNITPEHKIYIEDYLAKKMGGTGLKLGEKLEFSDDLLKEALQKSETLTSRQLENLTQYSQLVPSINY